MRFLARLAACALALALTTTPAAAAFGDFFRAFFRDRALPADYFERVATFPVFLNTDIDNETVAEIVAASEDGYTLVYTDSALEALGFVDITDPADPQPAGVVFLDGEPTSVAVTGDYALVGVNTSPSFIAPSGELVVVHIPTQSVVATHQLGGQPDSVAVSSDKRYAAVVIENERDENLGDGEPPQAPSGFLVIVDLVGAPGDWGLRHVSLDGVPDLFPQDAEPEYVDINEYNIAAVTLQENNHIVLVHLPTGFIIRDFPAGSVNLSQVDDNENDFIELNASLNGVPREPDGISWIAPFTMATADEGDLFGGSRGITFFSWWGAPTYSSGNDLEHAVVRLGHYPEDRSENKGNESENAEFGRFGEDRLLFVASERSSVIFVYDLGGLFGTPRLVQVLPAALGPEGVLAVPGRDLVIAASEEDSRDDGFRGSLNIYQRTGNRTYPTVESADRADGTPIPWGALSGLAVDPSEAGTVYTIHDSFYSHSRIYRMDVGPRPAVITGEIVLMDRLGALAAVEPGLVNADGTVNLDQEGVATRADGGFWVASEGAGT
ncbi:MAG: esterase-like activity of phytase family protein, partial [Chromatiales bacterium]